MKKFLILTTALVLTAAACNKQVVVDNGQNNQNQNSDQDNTLQYKNDQYGFTIDLQSDWNGYKVLNQQWEGVTLETGKVTDKGPKIIIRHPKWTTVHHYEDIPVMVMTPTQWDQISKGDLVVGAAPIPPTELGRNNLYVLVLPARYNFDYATGYEEADKIVHTLEAFDVISTVEVKISSLKPSSGKTDSKVTINGQGFTATDNLITFGESGGRHHMDGTADNVIAQAESSDGKTLTFTVPEFGPSGVLCDAQNKCIGISAILLQPGNFNVSVSNSNGTSNVVSFKITK